MLPYCLLLSVHVRVPDNCAVFHLILYIKTNSRNFNFWENYFAKKIKKKCCAHNYEFFQKSCETLRNFEPNIEDVYTGCLEEKNPIKINGKL